VAFLRAAGRHLRRAWSAARFVGDLWRDLVFGGEADAGDRHPHGVGREHRARAIGGDRQHYAAVLAGIALGAISSLIAAKWIAALLFKTETTDPGAFASTILLLGAVALLAGYIPARRASRIDPMIALRGN